MSEVTPQWTPPPPVYYGAPRPPTNGMAIAAMVISIVSLAGMCIWGPAAIFISPVGAVLGHISRRKIKESGEQGDGMALAGIIVGWVGVALSLLIVAVFAAIFIWIGSMPDYNPYDWESML